MSGPPAPVVLDPWNFPNFSDATLERDFAFLINGLSIYELVVCLDIYFSKYDKAKMKTGIFRLMTPAVFLLMLSTVLLIFLQLNVTEYDLVQADGEYELGCFNLVLIVIGKISYFIAGTLRSRALLSRFPKTLICLYIMLVVTIITNLILTGLVFNFLASQRFAPENFLENLPNVLKALEIYNIVTSFSTTFDMIFSNILIVSFLTPLFQALDMKLVPAVKAMAKLGDVHRAVRASFSSLVFVAFVFRNPPLPQLALSAVVEYPEYAILAPLVHQHG